MVVAPTVTTNVWLYFQGFLENVNGIKDSLMIAKYTLD